MTGGISESTPLPLSAEEYSTENSKTAVFYTTGVTSGRSEWGRDVLFDDPFQKQINASAAI